MYVNPNSVAPFEVIGELVPMASLELRAIAASATYYLSTRGEAPSDTMLDTFLDAYGYGELHNTNPSYLRSTFEYIPKSLVDRKALHVGYIDLTDLGVAGAAFAGDLLRGISQRYNQPLKSITGLYREIQRHPQAPATTARLHLYEALLAGGSIPRKDLVEIAITNDSTRNATDRSMESLESTGIVEKPAIGKYRLSHYGRAIIGAYMGIVETYRADLASSVEKSLESNHELFNPHGSFAARIPALVRRGALESNGSRIPEYLKTNNDIAAIFASMPFGAELTQKQLEELLELEPDVLKSRISVIEKNLNGASAMIHVGVRKRGRTRVWTARSLPIQEEEAKKAV